MDNSAIRQLARPWYDLFARTVDTSWLDLRAFIPRVILANMHGTERANMMHATTRENFRLLCKHLEPTMVLVEEKSGLDYIMLEDGGKRLALRWGKCETGSFRVRRNDTHQQRGIQEQGLLFPMSDEEQDSVPVVTLMHTVEDDYTLRGIPQAWVGRLVIVREQFGDCEKVDDVIQFAAPIHETGEEPSPAVRVTARQEAIEELEKAARKMKKIRG